MYELPIPGSGSGTTAPAPHQHANSKPRQRSRGLSTLSSLSLMHGEYDPGEMTWRDRLWLLGYRWVWVGVMGGWREGWCDVEVGVWADRAVLTYTRTNISFSMNRVDRWLFKGIPHGYPLRAKAKISLQVHIG